MANPTNVQRYIDCLQYPAVDTWKVSYNAYEVPILTHKLIKSCFIPIRFLDEKSNWFPPASETMLSMAEMAGMTKYSLNELERLISYYCPETALELDWRLTWQLINLNEHIPVF